MEIVVVIHREGRQIIRQSAQHLALSHIGDSISLKMKNSQVALLKVLPKWLYTAFKSRNQAPPTAQKKFLKTFPKLQIYWSTIYSLLFTVTKVIAETKIYEFQYKMLNNIVFTNEKIFRFKMIDSPLCTR